MFSLEELVEKIKKNDITEVNSPYKSPDTKIATELALSLAHNTSVTSFSLDRCFIGAEIGKLIAEALFNNKTITSLNLGFCNLSNNDPEAQVGKILANTLMVNKTITDINLNNCHFGPAVGNSFAQVLEVNSTLTSIHLSFLLYNSQLNAIEDRIGRILFNDASNISREECFINITNALISNKTLTNIDLSNNDLGYLPGIGDMLSDIIEHNKTLKRIDLGNNKLNPETGIAIAKAALKNKTLIHLDLRDNRLDSQCLPILAQALRDNRTLTTDIRRNEPMVNRKSKTKEWYTIDFWNVGHFNTRNSHIKSVLDEIIKLTPDIPMPRSHEYEIKEAEEFNVDKCYRGILYTFEVLKNFKDSKEIIDELMVKVLLEYCKWDTSDLTPRDRIQKLEEIVKSNKNLEVREKALSTLTAIFEHEAMIAIAEKRYQDAEDYLISTYTCALHGIQNQENLQLAAHALALWIDKDGDSNKKHNLSNLEKELASKDSEKFMRLQKSYQRKCKFLGIKSNQHLEVILKSMPSTVEPLNINPLSLDVEDEEIISSPMTDKKAGTNADLGILASTNTGTAGTGISLMQFEQHKKKKIVFSIVQPVKPIVGSSNSTL